MTPSFAAIPNATSPLTVVWSASMEAIYPGLENKKKVDNSLKGTYVLEIEEVILHNFGVLRRKRSFYYNALIFALLAILPYIVCLGYHFAKRRDNIQKVEIVQAKKVNFN